MSSSAVQIKEAARKDIPLVLSFIKGLAEYERLSHEVVADEKTLKQTLFGKRAYAEVVIARYGDKPAGFALFFHNYSTFLGRPGIYLEDLFVWPEYRSKGIGRSLLVHLAKLTQKRKCGRLEWAVLNWNEPAINFYKKLGGVPMSEWTVFRVAGDALEKLAG